MFVAHASRTMANAKPKLKLVDQLREIIREQDAREQERERERELKREQAAMRRQIAMEAARARADTYRELMGQQKRYRPTYQEIERRICRAYKITRSELHSTRRQRDLTLARHAAMYWACRLTGLSLPAIGRLMGGRDHTTVLHGKNRYPDRRAAMGRFLRPVR